MGLRYAELLGWSAQEIGHSDKAMRWTRMAAEWSWMIGDDEALGYALTRQSQCARRSGDAEAALGYARAAGTLVSISPRIWMFAAQREAQAHALLGDEGQFRSALDRYLALIGEQHDEEPADPTRPPWGPLPDTDFDNSRMLEATCLVDLGEFNAAATLFAGHSARLNGGRTGYARIGVREARAYAHVGEPELACEAAFRYCFRSHPI